MDFSLHEQRTLAKIEQELSEDRRLAALMTILDSKKSGRSRRWRAFWCRLRHPRQESLVTPGHHHPMDMRPLLALTIILAVVCAAVLVTALVMGTSALVVSASAVLPLPPALASVAYFRLRRANRRGR
jgi:Flp pilus assembly protein TadB